MYYLLFIIILFVIFKIKLKNVEIWWHTFFKKKPILIRDDNYFNVIIDGFQGSGKTYLAVALAQQTGMKKIVTNIKSFKHLKGLPVEYIDRITDIYNYQDTPYVLYIIDEIHKKYSKNAPFDKEFYSFLQQMRKKQSRSYIITQDWTQTPIWLRTPIKYIYHTEKKLFFHISHVLDAQTSVWSSETMSWSADERHSFVYMRNRDITECYDTREITYTL